MYVLTDGYKELTTLRHRHVHESYKEHPIKIDTPNNKYTSQIKVSGMKSARLHIFQQHLMHQRLIWTLSLDIYFVF